MHGSRTPGKQGKGKLEGRERQEHTCAAECICVAVDFPAEGTADAGVHSVSTEEESGGGREGAGLEPLLCVLGVGTTCPCLGLAGSASEAGGHVCRCQSTFWPVYF